MNSNQETSGDFIQAVVDRFEDTLALAAGQVRERPTVVVALIAGFVGALIGARLAGRRSQPPSPVRAASSGMADLAGAIVATLGAAELGRRGKDIAKGAEEARKGVGDATKHARRDSHRIFDRFADFGNAAELANLAVRLFENPLVRSIAIGMVTRQIRRRFDR